MEGGEVTKRSRRAQDLKVVDQLPAHSHLRSRRTFSQYLKMRVSQLKKNVCVKKRSGKRSGRRPWRDDGAAKWLTLLLGLILA